MDRKQTWLYKYYSAIKSGKIVAGHELISELERLIADLDNPKYYYDTTDADLKIRFMENCVRLTKSPFYGQPMKLMLWQKAFIEVAYSFKMAEDGTDRFRRILLLIARKNTKALDINTRIPTPEGDKTMSDINVGDLVYNADGKPVSVIGVSEIFENRKCYELTFEDGEKIVCDENHKWTVQTKDDDKHVVDCYGCITVFTYEMLNDFITNGSEYKYRVPISGKESLSARIEYKSIIDIKEVSARDTKCITVDDDRGLFLCGERNTVTHNSETCSGLALTELITGQDGEDIVCSSNDDSQANILYEAINTMRLMIDPMQADTWKNQQHIKCQFNGSKVFKLSDRTRNKEGRNIDFAIVDEIHEMKENTIIKSIEQSQSLKPNPKLILITTEGFVNDGFLDNELKRARAILNGEDDSISAERYLPWLYTQDSEQEIWSDEKTWYKSNPTLGIVKRWDYLREQVDAARKSKADRMFTLSKDFNFKVSNSEAWLMGENLELSGGFSLDSFRGSICLGGVDLAETTDMCSAKILLMRADDKTKYIHSMYWIPESKLSSSDDREAGARYSEWARDGLLRIVEGNEVDVSLVADWFAELYKNYQIRTYIVGYDQRFAKDFLKRMNEYGFDYEMIYQNRYTLSNPMRLVEADIKDGRINFNDNEIDKWCLLNTSVQVWDTGHIMPVKIKNQLSRRIDGTLSLIMCYEMLRRYRTEFQNAMGVN